MKKRYIGTICLMSAAALVAGIALPSLLNASAPAEVVEDPSPFSDSVVDEAPEAVDDGIGAALPFPATRLKSNLAATVHTAIGVQSYVRDADAGTSDLRFVVALTDYEGLKEASFTRTVETLDGEEVKSSATFEVDTVYLSVHEASTVKWSTALDSTKTYYYAVYTMRGIPEDEYGFDAVVNVTFNATNLDGTTLTATQSANLAGVVDDFGIENVQVSTEAAADGTVTYYAHRLSSASSSTTAKVPEYVASPRADAPYVGEKSGPITELRMISNYGTFENFTSLQSVSIPDTIKSFGNYAFDDCEDLVELPLPRDLVSIGSNVFNFASGDALTTINWDAVNLTTINDTIGMNVGVVNVSADVTALPTTRLFSTNYAPVRVNYAGTEAEWAALIAENEVAGGLNIDNVWCSDTVAYTVTFHIGEAKVGELTGDHAVQVIGGKTVDNIGDASWDGYVFGGWSATEGGTEEYDFSAAITADLDLYPIFETAPAGSTTGSPATYTGVAEAVTVNTLDEYPIYYVAFTPEEAGAYYLAMADVNNAAGSSSSNAMLRAYEENWTTEIQYPSVSAISASNIDGEIKGSSSYSSTSGDRNVLIDAVAGKTYRFALSANRSYSYGSGYTYLPGSFTFSITKSEDAVNDTVGKALEVARGEEFTFAGDAYTARYYKYVPEESGEVYFKAKANGVWASVELYSYDAEQDSYTEMLSYGVSGTNERGETLELTAGVAYYVVVYSHTNTANSPVNVSFGDIPAGYRIDTLAAMPESGSTVSIPSYQGYLYYSYTPTQDGQHSLLAEGTTTSYALSLAILNADGTAVKTATASSSTSIELLANLTANMQYIVRVGYASTPSSTFQVTLTYGLLEAGSRYETALESLTWYNDSAVVIGSTTETYYKWTETADGAGTYSLSMTSSDEGTTATVTDRDGVELELTPGAAGQKVTFAEGGVYYLVVKATAPNAVITLTKGVYTPPLANETWLDKTNGTTFVGSREGSSEWSISFHANADTYSWDGGSTAYELGAVTVDDNGNSTFSEINGSNRTFYVKDTLAWVNYGGYSYFYSSLATTANYSTTYALFAETSNASETSGTKVASIRNDDGTDVSAAMIDGKVYLGVTIAFLEGDSIEGTSTFTISYDGAVIGAYSSTNGTLVSDATYAIEGYYGAVTANLTDAFIDIGPETVAISYGEESYDFAFVSRDGDSYEYVSATTGVDALLVIVDNDTTFSISFLDADRNVYTLGDSDSLYEAPIRNVTAVAQDIDPTITNTSSSTYQWTIGADGTYTSPKGFSSTTYYITFANPTDSDWTISFHYVISTESGWDKMYVYNGNTSVSLPTDNSGDVEGDLELEVAAGDTVRIGYSKDSGGNGGDDNIILSNLLCQAINYEMGDPVKMGA